MGDFSFLEKVVIWSVPVLFGITVHEVAHGWVASKLGDFTARQLGRLTLNPLKHIDPVGTVVLPLLLLMVSNFVFGWAKPVPVNWNNLGHPRRDMALVALAGPGANFIMMLLWFFLAKLMTVSGLEITVSGRFIIYMCSAGIIINIVLMVLNLLPLVPLDGGRILAALLPANISGYYSKLEPYGLIIILVLLATGILGKILGPPIKIISSFIYSMI